MTTYIVGFSVEFVANVLYILFAARDEVQLLFVVLDGDVEDEILAIRSHATCLFNQECERTNFEK